MKFLVVLKKKFCCTVLRIKKIIDLYQNCHEQLYLSETKTDNNTSA